MWTSFTTPQLTPTGQRSQLGNNPAAWWRTICTAADRLSLSGDLHPDDDRAIHQLNNWRDHGITHVIDCRAEYNESERMARLAPDLHYTWVGTDDHLGKQDDYWFDAGVRAAFTALSDPKAHVLIHCHMGVNRGPSMGFAIMIAAGIEPIDALEAIRGSRPIAGIIYADQAIDWWTRSIGEHPSLAEIERERVTRWLDEHQLDAGWIISRIRIDARRKDNY
ncbi:MAG: dual specificity protein phosphatase family protein [Ilumatobacteraceae bacterium]